MQHLLGQCDCCPRQRPAVRHDDETDGHRRPPAAKADAAAAISIAADVAPGS